MDNTELAEHLQQLLDACDAIDDKAQAYARLAGGVEGWIKHLADTDGES